MSDNNITLRETPAECALRTSRNGHLPWQLQLKFETAAEKYLKADNHDGARDLLEEMQPIVDAIRTQAKEMVEMDGIGYWDAVKTALENWELEHQPQLTFPPADFKPEVHVDDLAERTKRLLGIA